MLELDDKVEDRSQLRQHSLRSLVQQRTRHNVAQERGMRFDNVVKIDCRFCGFDKLIPGALEQLKYKVVFDLVDKVQHVCSQCVALVQDGDHFCRKVWMTGVFFYWLLFVLFFFSKVKNISENNER